MEDFSAIIHLIIKLIKNPIRTIKSTALINYNSESLFKLIVITSIILGYQFSFFVYGTENIGILLFIPILAPFFFSIINNLTVLLYFILFKVGGKEIKSSYESIKVLLYPVISARLVFAVILFIIAWLMPNLSEISKLVVDIWFVCMIFIILMCKFKQSIVRSSIICMIPILLVLINVFLK